MKTLIAALGTASVCLSSGDILAAQSEQQIPPTAPSVRVLQSTFQNSASGGFTEAPANVLFADGNAAEQSMDRRLERLKDPQQRAQLRAEHEAMLRQHYPDMAVELGIDPATEAKVFELMTDEYIANLEQFANRDYARATQERADAETKRISAMRATLGEEGVRKYEHYLATSYERSLVARLDNLMSPADKLQPEQKRQLIELYGEESRRRNPDRQMQGWSIRPFEQVPDPEELQRQAQLMTIGANEDSVRAMMAWHPELESRAAQFLSPSQVAVLSRDNQKQLASLKSWIETARVEAGLDPTIPAQPDPVLAPPADERRTMSGRVAYEVEVSVDGEKRQVTHTGENGKPFDIRASEQLWIRATPTLYEDHWLDVRLEYLEQTPAGKQALNHKTGFGSLLVLPDGTATRGGMTTDVVTGQKGYAVQFVVNAKPLPDPSE